MRLTRSSCTALQAFMVLFFILARAADARLFVNQTKSRPSGIIPECSGTKLKCDAYYPIPPPEHVLDTRLGAGAMGMVPYHLTPLTGNASMSSTFESVHWVTGPGLKIRSAKIVYDAQNCADGNNYTRCASSWDNETGEANPWWQLDLGQSELIAKMSILSAPDSCELQLDRAQENLSCGMDGAIFGVSLEPCVGEECSGNVCGQMLQPPDNGWYDIDCGGYVGRYVYVQLKGPRRHMHFWELTAYKVDFGADADTKEVEDDRMETQDGKAVILRREEPGKSPLGADGNYVQRAAINKTATEIYGGCKFFCLQDPNMFGMGLLSNNPDKYCWCYTSDLRGSMYNLALKYPEENVEIATWSYDEPSFQGYTRIDVKGDHPNLCLGPENSDADKAYEVSEVDLWISSFNVTAKCAKGYAGGARAVRCPGDGIAPYTLTGCHPEDAYIAVPAFGTPTMSSTFGGHGAELCSDRDGTTRCASLGEESPWWQLDLGFARAIYKVRISVHFGDCDKKANSSGYKCSIEGALVGVSSTPCVEDNCTGEVCGTLGSFDQDNWAEASCELKKGRFVWVQVPGSHILNFREVEVLKDGMSMIPYPLPGIASQSSTWHTAESQKCNDGREDTSCSTELQQSPWWQMDLGGEYFIAQLRLIGDPLNISGAVLGVSMEKCDAQGKCGEMAGVCGIVTAQSNGSYEATCRGMAARYVYVQLQGSKTLHFHELVASTVKEPEYMKQVRKKGKASMKAPSTNAPARLCSDGRSSTRCSGAGTADPWWQLDLERPTLITRLDLSASDASLKDAVLGVSLAPCPANGACGGASSFICGRVDKPDAAGVSVDCGEGGRGMLGRYVYLQLPGQASVTFSELTAFSYEELIDGPSSDPCKTMPTCSNVYHTCMRGELRQCHTYMHGDSQDCIAGVTCNIRCWGNRKPKRGCWQLASNECQNSYVVDEIGNGMHCYLKTINECAEKMACFVPPESKPKPGSLYERADL